MSKPKLLFFTGAGISAESGLETFRNSKNGLWNNFKIKEAMTCAVCVVVGTSLEVYPANSLPDYVPFGSQMIVIDPMINKMDLEEKRDILFINKKAVEGMQMVYDSFSNL